MKQKTPFEMKKRVIVDAIKSGRASLHYKGEDVAEIRGYNPQEKSINIRTSIKTFTGNVFISDVVKVVSIFSIRLIYSKHG